MKEILIVGVGGGLGSIARYLLSTLILQHTPNWKFPACTLTVNLLGCLLAGILWGFAHKRGLLAGDSSLFLLVGLLGGFTTFSAFGLETVNLMRRGETDVAAWYVALSLLGGLVLLWCGMKSVPLPTN